MSGTSAGVQPAEAVGMLRDQYGNAGSTDGPADVVALDLFVGEVLGHGRRSAPITAAAQAAPGCALVNACAATLMTFMETGDASALARPFPDAALAAPPATERERLRVRAVQGRVEERIGVAVEAIGQIVAAHPCDLFALKLGRTHRLPLGDFDGMRRLSATALSACNEIGFVHGMHAFALEQCHCVPEAEHAALRALALCDQHVRGVRKEYSYDQFNAVALPAARGLYAAGQGRHAEAMEHLKPVTARMQEVGGSHAQRDLFELVFLDALERAGELPRGRAMVEQRIIDQRHVAWQHRLLARLHRRGKPAPMRGARESRPQPRLPRTRPSSTSPNPASSSPPA